MRKVLLAVSLASIILGACSNSSGGLDKTEAALVQLDEAWQSYLKDPYPPFPETPLDEKGFVRPKSSSGRVSGGWKILSASS